jgi:hypothetical protein
MIAYIYRPKRQRNGKLVSSRIWRARLKLDGDVKARDISLGVSDRQVAEQKMRENIRDQERVSVGLMAPAAQRETFENPMEKLVDGYVADLKALGRSVDHVRHVDKRLAAADAGMPLAEPARRHTGCVPALARRTNTSAQNHQ